jgi:hypothetical protein
MTIISVYVKGKSKKALNERLAAGHIIPTVQYTPTSEITWPMHELPHGTVIKVYEKVIMGSPYAKAYGTWDANKGRVK